MKSINLTERGKVIARIIPASAGPLDSLDQHRAVCTGESAWPGARPTPDARRSRPGNAVERMRAEERRFSVIYLETSALVKLIRIEVESDALADWLDDRTELR